MTKEQAKERILESVREYYEAYVREGREEFRPGDPVRYAGRVYGHEELVNGVDSVLEFWLTAGRYTRELEESLGEYLGVRHVALTNSGSSANLLAFMVLTSHLLPEEALSERTKAVFVAHTLGIPFDAGIVKAFCDRHGLWLVEDNCDALGAEVLLDGEWKKMGTVGDMGTSSFYPTHHMTTGEGGAVYTDDPVLRRATARSCCSRICRIPRR